MISAEIIKDLKKSIARGSFKPGQRLIESFLCKEYNVGRTRIREALRQLDHDGFVKIIPHAGAVVTEFSQKDVEQIYDVLGALEGLSVRVATPFISVKEIEKIEGFAKKIEEADISFESFVNNFRFHNYLTSLSSNSYLIKFMENLRAQSHRISLRSFYNPGQITASINEHAKIVEAIKERDPLKVEKLIRNHYLLAKNRLIKYINRSL